LHSEPGRRWPWLNSALGHILTSSRGLILGGINKREFGTGIRDVLHIFTFMENHKAFPNWPAEYENVKNVSSIQIMAPIYGIVTTVTGFGILWWRGLPWGN
jgi:hypothetical protein